MSPTVFKIDGYRYFFFSREEERKHIHVISGDGEAKFWIEPKIELAKSHKFTNKHLNIIETFIKENYDEFINAWNQHFGS